MNVLRSTYAAYLAIAVMALSACSRGGGEPAITTPGPAASLVADAGQDQSVFVGTFVTLNGSKSTNANQTGLTYAWTLAKPAGSSATLSNPTSVTPTLTVDVEGTYEATLIVTDARQTTLSSAPDTVLVTANKTDLRPTAHAGDDRSVFVNQPVTLDGSGSRASGNKQLAFNWSFKERPTGSNATLSDATAKTPSFTPDISGPYKLRLVVNDGTKDSTEDDVTITASVKPPPTADAGSPQSAKPGTLITLDGSKSSAAGGAKLTFSWSLSLPTGSSAILAKADTQSPTFTADQFGTYVAQLIVNDGTSDSAAVTVKITVSNDLPVANAGNNTTVRLCHPKDLDGSASTNRDGSKIPPLSFSWTVVANPNGIAELADTNTDRPKFTAYKKAKYQVNLVVSDGMDSPPASVIVEATTNYPIGSSLPTTYSPCDSCHKVGIIDPNGSDDELSNKGREVRKIFRDAAGQSISHKNLSLTEDNIRDLCDFFQAN